MGRLVYARAGGAENATKRIVQEFGDEYGACVYAAMIFTHGPEALRQVGVRPGLRQVSEINRVAKRLAGLEQRQLRWLIRDKDELVPEELAKFLQIFPRAWVLTKDAPGSGHAMGILPFDRRGAYGLFDIRANPVDTDPAARGILCIWPAARIAERIQVYHQFVQEPIRVIGFGRKI